MSHVVIHSFLDVLVRVKSPQTIFEAVMSELPSGG